MKHEAQMNCMSELKQRCEEAEARADNAEREVARLVRDIELLLLQRIQLWSASKEQCRLVSDAEAGNRVAMMLSDAVPKTDDAVSRTFLGLNLYGWATMPDDIASVFGLHSAVCRWRQQMAVDVNPQAARGFSSTIGAHLN